MSFSEIPIFEMNRKVKKLYKCVLVKESESIAASCFSILYLYFRSKWKKQGQKSLRKKLYAPPIFLLIFLLNFCLSKKEESPFKGLFVGSPLLLLLSSCYLIKWKLFYFEMTFRNPLMPLLTFCCTTIVLQISLASPLPSPPYC